MRASSTEEFRVQRAPAVVPGAPGHRIQQRDPVFGVCLSAARGDARARAAFSVSTIRWFDLRLLGLTMRRDPVSGVFNQLRPWMTAGFLVMILTGSLLFASRAADAYASSYFRIKAGLLVLGAGNGAGFHTPIAVRAGGGTGPGGRRSARGSPGCCR